MRFDLNRYAVVEDKDGLHLVPSFRKGSYPTVLLDASPIAAAGVYLSICVAIRGTGCGHVEANTAAMSQIGRKS